MLEQRQSGLEFEVKKLSMDLNKKGDKIAADLTEHRADTEIYKVGYRIGDSAD